MTRSMDTNILLFGHIYLWTYNHRLSEALRWAFFLSGFAASGDPPLGCKCTKTTTSPDNTNNNNNQTNKQTTTAYSGGQELFAPSALGPRVPGLQCCKEGGHAGIPRHASALEHTQQHNKEHIHEIKKNPTQLAKEG